MPGRTVNVNTEVDKVPLPLRAIIGMVLYIRGAAGPSEYRQMLTILGESDPAAAGWLKEFIDRLDRGIVNL